MLFPDHPEFSEGLRQVLTRAMTDPAFRALCLEDPAAAYREAAGPVPAGAFPFRFRAGAGVELILGLPEAPNPDQPLSDPELDQVAGGRGEMSKGNTNNPNPYACQRC